MFLSPRDQDQIIRIGGKHLYLPSHLSGPKCDNMLKYGFKIQPTRPIVVACAHNHSTYEAEEE